LAQLEASRETARQVLDEVSSELWVLRAALEGTALPVPRRPWPEVPVALQTAVAGYKLDPVQSSWLMPIAKRIYVDDDAMRRAHISVTQWVAADELITVSERVSQALPGAPASRQEKMMADFHPGRLRASVLPLTHLHVTFQGMPVFAKLFPPPKKMTP